MVGQADGTEAGEEMDIEEGEDMDVEGLVWGISAITLINRDPYTGRGYRRHNAC